MFDYTNFIVIKKQISHQYDESIFVIPKIITNHTHKTKKVSNTFIDIDIFSYY